MTQVAIVTGGGRGLGRAFAVGLAKDGWRVAVVSRTAGEVDATVELIRGAGGQAIGVRTDVTDERQVRAMVATAEEQLGGAVDLLVNNAGSGPPFGPTWEASGEEWWRTLEVNLKGPMLCCQAVTPGMVQRGRGRIINVASGAGTVGIPYLSAYVTSKTALIRFTEVLAQELKPHGVWAFAIEPGTVRTAMAEQAIGSEEGRRWLPWLAEIFEKGQDVSEEPGTRLVLSLASGKYDGQSGHFFVVEPERDFGVLRMREKN